MTHCRLLCKGRALPLAVFMLFVLVSCSDDEGYDASFAISDMGSNGAFTGTWDGEYDGEVYTIDAERGTFDSAGAYAGSDMIIVHDSSTTGRFIIKYTRALKSDGSYTYSTIPLEAPDVGKWYAVYFRVIDYNTMALAGGWKSGSPSAFDSAAECQMAMTYENGYFTMTSECRRR